jgi:hypothetical protein
MIINLKSSSLGAAIKENEEKILDAIRFAATQSANSMGHDFKNVYYRSCQSLEQIKQKAA